MNLVAAGAKGATQRLIGVQSRAALLEHHTPQAIRGNNGAFIWFMLTRNGAKHHTLATTVGPQQAKLGTGRQHQLQTRE